MELNMNNTTNPQVTSVNLEVRGPFGIALCATILCIIMLLAILGNLLVILAIYKHNSLRENISSLFLVNLSLTDITMAVIVMSTALVTITMDWKNINYTWCVVWSSTNYCLHMVTMLTLCFISIERYIAIIHPLYHMASVTRKKVLISLSYSWLQGIAFTAPTIFKKWIHYDYWEGVCAINRSGKLAKMYSTVTTPAMIFCFILPCLIMIFCYTRIIHKVVSRPSESITRHSQENNKNKNIIFSLVTVVVVYLACYSPFIISKSVRTASIYVPGYVNLVAAFLGYTLSAVNPFIYGIFRPEFRRAYKRFLHVLANTAPLTSHPENMRVEIEGRT